EHEPLDPTYPVHVASKGVSKIVIVGAGAAGTAAGEMLRRCGYRGDVTIVDDDEGSPYDRPNLSKDYLAGNAPEEWIPIRPPNFYDEHRVTFIRARVTKLDPARHTLHVDGRAPLGYDTLILATGAEPARLTTEGADLPHVHYLRSLRDSRALIAASGRAKQVVVLGASFI